MPDGSVWLVRAATASAGHGRSPDLVVADELWDINDGVIDDGLIPAQRARPAPLFSGWSTAGTEASTWFLRTREAALRAIDTNERGSLYYAEYSPAPSADLTNPETWAAANPALGHTLQLETLIDESRGPNRSAFMRASLNLWVAAASAWLEPGTWDRCHVPGDLPAPVVLAVDLSTDGGRFSGVAAGFDSAGRVVPWVAFQCPTEHEAWEHIERMMAGPGVRLAVTPPLEIHTPPRLKPRTSTVGYGELVKWTALVERMISDGRVAHRGDVALSDHLARAVAVRTQNGLAISSQKSPGPVELARLFVFAAALCSIPADKSRPAMGRARTVPTVRR
jgi:phage terminase large subunit-like protein